MENYNWGGHAQLVLLLVAIAAPFMQTFATYAFYYGGVTYILGVAVILVIFGIPLFYLQILTGQFTRSGPYGIWKAFPAGRGLAVALIILLILMLSLYVMNFSRHFVYIYYVLSSDAANFPWITCTNKWNTETCKGPHDGIPNSSFVTTTTEYEYNYNRPATTHPADEFYKVNMFTSRLNVGDVAAVVLQWILVTAPLVLGPRSLLFCLFLVFPFAIFLDTLLLLRAVTLPGFLQGLRYHFIPSWPLLGSVRVWVNMFKPPLLWMLASNTGCLYVVGKYSPRKTFALPHVVLSIVVVFVIFILNCVKTGGLAGFYGHEFGVGFNSFYGGANEFGVTPVSLTHLPAAKFWLIVHFLHHVLLFVPLQSVMLEVLGTSLAEMIPFLGTRAAFPRSVLVPVGVGLIGFVINLIVMKFGSFRHMLMETESLLDLWAVIFLFFVVSAVIPVAVSRVVTGVGEDLLSFVGSQGGHALASARKGIVVAFIIIGFVCLLPLKLLFLHEIFSPYHMYSGYFIITIVIVIVVVVVTSIVEIIVGLVKRRRVCCPTRGWNRQEGKGEEEGPHIPLGNVGGNVVMG